MRVLGLVGYPLEHSFSPDYFRKKFMEEGIHDMTYALFPLSDINALWPELIDKQPGLIGFNVTIPYKQSIIPLLDWVAPEAKELGAVNTVKVLNQCGKILLYGYNTDVIGFQYLYEKIRKKSDKRALVFGSGGSAKAVMHILQKQGIKSIQVSRIPQHNMLTYEALTTDIVNGSDLLINCTPVGMYPKDDKKLAIPYAGLDGHQGLIDLIYNPPKTEFLKEGEERGCRTINGQLMLEQQAEASWRIWNDKTDGAP
jgi:shikimate dehydrogenase